MKKVIIILVSILGITTANASEISRITSQRGVTQAQWEATDEYKSFTCPEGTGRGVGVDMNFTTDRSDDTWFATCNIRETRAPLEVITPTPVIDTSTATTVATTETSTAQTTTQITTIVPPVITTPTDTVTTTIAPVITVIPTQTETPTISTSVSVGASNNLSYLVSYLKQLIKTLLEMIASLK